MRCVGLLVEQRCRSLTKVSQNLGQREPGQLIPPGIWTLADVLQYGRDNTICPYFLVRRMVRSLFPSFTIQH